MAAPGTDYCYDISPGIMSDSAGRIEISLQEGGNYKGMVGGPIAPETAGRASLPQTGVSEISASIRRGKGLAMIGAGYVGTDNDGGRQWERPAIAGTSNGRMIGTGNAESPPRGEPSFTYLIQL